MRVIGIDVLDQFKRKQVDAQTPLDIWLAEARSATWTRYADVVANYRSVDFVQPNNLIFNIKGNTYRLWIKIDYKRQLVMIEKVGRHEAYESWKIK